VFGKVPENLEDFAFASQAVQAEAKKFFIEMFRNAKWRRTGIIWWNLLDGWPQFSDAVVDYYFKKKTAYNYIKRSQQHLCLIGREPVNCRQEFVACNDLLKDTTVKYKISDIDSEDELLSGEKLIKGNTVTSLGIIPFHEKDKRFYLIEFEYEPGVRRWNHYLAGNAPFELEKYKNWLNKLNQAAGNSRGRKLPDKYSVSHISSYGVVSKHSSRKIDG
jgi:beta-mannosidase